MNQKISTAKAALQILDAKNLLRGRVLKTRQGDAGRLDVALFWLKTTNANEQCIEVVERMKAFAAAQEGLPVWGAHPLGGQDNAAQRAPE